MNIDLYKKIIEDHQELASLPQTLAEVLRVIKDENSSASELGEVLRHDPALATKILRVVNSPVYGSSREITTMTQAVMTLGMRAVSALALSTSVYDITGKWNGTIDRSRFWRHSLEVAIGCREIGAAIGMECPEEAFIAGLIHDIGLLILEKSFPEKFQRIWQQAESGENIFDLADQVWGTNHARIGRFLFEQWNLPESICEAIGHFHNEFSPGNTDADFRLAQIIALSDSLSRFTITSGKPHLTGDREKRQILCCNLDLDPDKLREIDQTLFQKTSEESKFLDIEIGSLEELLTEANQMLYEQYLTVENLMSENSLLHEQVARDKLKKAALDALTTITATFNHYINNAAATILGRAQLVEVGIDKGDFTDHDNALRHSMQVIANGVTTITSVMEELKNLSHMDTVVYHDDTYVINIESKLKKKLKLIGQAGAEVCKQP